MMSFRRINLDDRSMSRSLRPLIATRRRCAATFRCLGSVMVQARTSDNDRDSVWDRSVRCSRRAKGVKKTDTNVAYSVKFYKRRRAQRHTRHISRDLSEQTDAARASPITPTTAAGHQCRALLAVPRTGSPLVRAFLSLCLCHERWVARIDSIEIRDSIDNWLYSAVLDETRMYVHMYIHVFINVDNIVI